MMDTNKLMVLIDVALKEVDNYIQTDYDGDETPMAGTKKVLSLLKQEVQHHPENINERVLRAMHDTGIAAVKMYYNSPLEDAIKAITKVLYYDLPSYKTLEPLRNDFGKGYPV